MNDDLFAAEQLHFAARDGDLARAAQLLADGCSPHTFDDLDYTPLHYAAKYEHFEIVSLLLRHGADVNAHNEPRIGNTPIAEIAGACSLEMAKLLLDAGADPTIPGWMQLTALDRVQSRKRGEGPAVFELMLVYSRGHHRTRHDQATWPAGELGDHRRQGTEDSEPHGRFGKEAG